MRLGPKIITGTAFVVAGCLAWLSASLAADVVEFRSLTAVKTALLESDHDWATVHTDGLQVHVGGEAPSEAARFNALSVSGRVVEASRVIDGTTVRPAEPLEAPDFSIEILRNDAGIQLIGLVPAALDRAAMADEIRALAEGAEVTDFLETADYPVPPRWAPALDYALDALARLPRSKISVSAGAVAITAISGSRAEQRRLEARLARQAPDSVRVSLDISAPRPVLTPFTLRFLIDGDGARFDACSADDEEARERILAAARAAGLEGKGECPLGLGVPTPDWAEAAAMGIEAVAALGHGSITFSDADVALVAAPGTDPARFDDVVGALESNLPAVFSLEAVLPEPEAEAAEDGPPPPRFTATRSPEGQVQLRGRLPDATTHATVESFARARFGVGSVYMAARQEAEGLPEDWPVRVLAGLAALARLDHGAVTVLADRLSVEGRTGDREARAEIARLLAEKLGEPAGIALDVTYDERLDPLADLPTPQECIRRIEIVLAERKITFAPGSAEIEGESAEVVDEIAEVLRACREVEMQVEIAGHTDSQGRETMNRDLSEARAMAVLEALADRRVPISRITAKGYGETQPIADNDSEAGREANRRIEFRLLAPAPAAGESAEGVMEAPGAQPPDGSADAGAEPEDGDGTE